MEKCIFRDEEVFEYEDILFMGRRKYAVRDVGDKPLRLSENLGCILELATQLASIGYKEVTPEINQSFHCAGCGRHLNVYIEGIKDS